MKQSPSFSGIPIKVTAEMDVQCNRLLAFGEVKTCLKDVDNGMGDPGNSKVTEDWLGRVLQGLSKRPYFPIHNPPLGVLLENKLGKINKYVQHHLYLAKSRLNCKRI